MKRKPNDPRAATEIDRKIGENIRRIRLAKGFSQTALAENIGVTFQQVQKIESSKNRIAASRLYTVAKFLETPIARFFGE